MTSPKPGDKVRNWGNLSHTKVLRYSLDIVDHQEIRLPAAYGVLSVAPDRTGTDTIDLWVVVAPSNQPATLHIYIFGTGNPLPESDWRDMKFIGTCVMPNRLVWHVFTHTS